MLIQLLFVNPVLFLMVAVAIIFAISIHEYSHAQMAYFLGDSTAKYQGRLTLNPLAHIDPFGTILLFIVGIGWGKPVPFNPYNLRSQKWGPALVSLAGPLSNFLIALIVGLPLRFLELSVPGLVTFLSIFVLLNINLGVFNLIPIPPLDGSHLFFALFPSLENMKTSFFRGNPLLVLVVILLMAFVISPLICESLYALITGMSLSF